MTMNVQGPVWMDLDAHHRWLKREQERLLQFHERHALAGDIGYAPLDREGKPLLDGPRELYATARLVYCFALAHLMGRPGAATIARHGLEALSEAFLDTDNGGWFNSISRTGTPLDTTKNAYAHAFVLLAAAGATQAGLDGAADLLGHVDAVLDKHFWREDEGAAVDALTADWTLLEPGYRGQNANMHLTEAYIAAFEATGDSKFQRRAERISTLIIVRNGETSKWRIPEHFDDNWVADPAYNIDGRADPFRPYGSLVGHWFEWARLLLQLNALPGSKLKWAPEAARQLFAAATRDGWNVKTGGVVYTVDLEGNPVNINTMHWAMAEAVGAAVYLYRATSDPTYEAWYRRFWSYISLSVIDRKSGSWWHELDSSGKPAFETWSGKPDLYHALQATLYARADSSCGLARAAHDGRIL
ncbi:AGE family epimerase/isomerase [Arthrobacter sp. NPDC058127]|uniref:AGE family epimerase/isomerase n=1 Tax=Arthrobacter sp. NPDC058127 TaxID=3346351 RepID=UPI0036EADFC3